MQLLVDGHCQAAAVAIRLNTAATPGPVDNPCQAAVAIRVTTAATPSG